MKFSEIEQMTRQPSYTVDVSWSYLEEHLIHAQREERASLNLEPTFQRAHVWTEQQQIDYVEFKLRGGAGSDELLFNCTGWGGDYRGPFVIVDGKQRLHAVLKFLRGNLAIFGGNTIHDFEDDIRRAAARPSFKWSVNDLETQREVLAWYVGMNVGGTPHTDEEIERVREMLEAEPLPPPKPKPKIQLTASHEPIVAPPVKKKAIDSF